MSKPKIKIKNPPRLQPTDLEPAYREALAVHEVLRRLGFDVDDIYFMLDKQTMSVVLKAQDQQFVINVGQVRKADATKFARDLSRAAEGYNKTFTDAERKEILHSSSVYANSVILTTELVMKGFAFPCRMN